MVQDSGEVIRYCGACGYNVVPGCLDSFARKGIRKVHWECWSDCNLHCAFCYRTVDPPLSTTDGTRMLASFATAGARSVVFAGGDPSLRPDLGELIRVAHSRGLLVEVQTNAHHVTTDLTEVLTSDMVALVGLSLDGPTAVEHDSFRSTRGNFSRVVGMLNLLESRGSSVILRTVVAAPNHRSVDRTARLISQYSCIRRWSLVEFSAVGAGYRNRAAYEISHALYAEAVGRATAAYSGNAEIDDYALRAKAGVYALVTASGRLYGTSGVLLDGRHPTVGSFLTDHLKGLADALPFDKELHIDRYGAGLSPALDKP